MKQVICQILLYVLLLGIGVVCLCSLGEFVEDMKDFVRELRQPGAIKEFLGMAAMFVMFVGLWFVF